MLTGHLWAFKQHPLILTQGILSRPHALQRLDRRAIAQPCHYFRQETYAAIFNIASPQGVQWVYSLFNAKFY